MVSKEGIDVLVRKDGSPVTSSENMKQRPQNADKYLNQDFRNQEQGRRGVYTGQDPPTGPFMKESQSQLYNLALTDQQEQREIAKHYREMQRDDHRSNLRREEQRLKQLMHEIYEEIIVKENTYYYIRLNGSGNGLYHCKVFSALIQDIQCFRYQGSSEILWQVTLSPENGCKEDISPLYTQDYLRTRSRLKGTILGKYDCSNGTKGSAIFWEYLRKNLISGLDTAKITEIPASPGWYKEAEDYHFYTMADDDTSRFSPDMKEFNMSRYNGLDMSTILCLLVNDLERAGDPNTAGMILMYRIGTFIGSLTEELCFRTGMVVYGEEAEAVAHYYLRTMINNVDTVNLDSDRIGKIREKVSAMKDTPVIYMVSDPGNRSVHNRLREVLSWMRTSRMEGKLVRAPFVFCLKYFSVAIPLEDMLVADASCIKLLREDQILDKFQFLMIEEIEKSGSHWVDEIAKRYKQYRKNGMCEAVSMVKMIKDVLLKMFHVIEVSDDLHYRFQKLLEAGEAEIEKQLSERTGRLAEIFCDQVKELVEAGQIKVYSKDKAPVNNGRDSIYFDDECYYFTTEALKKVCALAGIDKKSVLYIKRKLCELSMVKTYRATGYRQEEMNIDFRIYNAYGQCQDLSGLAIKREFWDEIGGIALCER